MSNSESLWVSSNKSPWFILDMWISLSLYINVFLRNKLEEKKKIVWTKKALPTEFNSRVEINDSNNKINFCSFGRFHHPFFFQNIEKKNDKNRRLKRLNAFALHDIDYWKRINFSKKTRLLKKVCSIFIVLTRLAYFYADVTNEGY